MSEDQARQETANRLRLVGRIVDNGISDERMTVPKAAAKWGISKSQLYRITRGETSDPLWYAEIEARLGYPRRLLRMVAEGRADVIRAMTDLEPTLSIWVLGELEKINKGDTPGEVSDSRHTG